MSGKTKIEWTESTWNPTTGCTKISPGCKNCYAEVMARRLKAMGAGGYSNGFELSLLPERLDQPKKRKKPTIYFVNSMSDLFHEGVTDAFIHRVFDTIRLTPWHTYQILTKRAERLAEFFHAAPPPPNTWLGVSVEDRRHGVPRIAQLAKVSATVRFLSVEPLLEDLGELDLSGIHWVIVGGESGPKARPMKTEWVDNIRLQCENYEAHFFFKQWGGWGADGQRRSKKSNGRHLNGRTWDAIPNHFNAGASIIQSISEN